MFFCCDICLTSTTDVCIKLNEYGNMNKTQPPLCSHVSESGRLVWVNCCQILTSFKGCQDLSTDEKPARVQSFIPQRKTQKPS